jgi:hypothetical protein
LLEHLLEISIFSNWHSARIVSTCRQQLDKEEIKMQRIAYKARGQHERNLKRLTTIAVASIMLGGSAVPLSACIPQMNAEFFRVEPVKAYNQAPLLLADADDSLKARTEVNAERIPEHADRVGDRARVDAHEAGRDVRIHADRAEVRVREHADSAARWTDRRIDDAQRHHQMEERNDD